MGDALGAEERVGYLANVAGVAAENDDLEAVLVVDVDVHGRDDLTEVLVLYAVELVAQVAGVVVEDERQYAEDLGIGRLGDLLIECVAHEVAYGLGAVLGSAAAGDVGVESACELFGHGDGESHEIAHDFLLIRRCSEEILAPRNVTISRPYPPYAAKLGMMGRTANRTAAASGTDERRAMSESDAKKNGSNRRCMRCGKTEDEGASIVSIPPNVDLCTECLEEEISQMSQMFGFTFEPQPDDGDEKKKADAKKDKKKPSDKKSDGEGGDGDGDGIEVVEGEAVDDEGDADDGPRAPIGGWGPFGNINFYSGSGNGSVGMGAPRASGRKRGEDEPVMNPVPLPHELKAQLDEYVVGQELAKKIVSVAVYNHYKRYDVQETSDVTIEKSNILMLGPTGTGKTHIIKTLARILDVPLAISDATTLTQAGYVGDDIESIITKLITAADGDVERAEHGIVYLDEVDKIAKKNPGSDSPGGTRDIGGEAVQQGLLKLLEGTVMDVPVSGGMKTPFSRNERIDTSNILFICGGAFPGLERIIERRLNKSAGIGFAATTRTNFEGERNLFREVAVEDLKEYGLIPEFLGRMPVLCTMEALDEEMLYDILTKPHDALIKQYQALMAYDGVELAFDDSALHEVSKRALEQETGARALRSILEKFMLDIMYEVPKDPTIGSVTITGDYIRGTSAPIVMPKGEALLDAPKPQIAAGAAG